MEKMGMEKERSNTKQVNTERLTIRVASDSEMLTLIEAETDEGLKAAYREMYDHCQKNPSQREWYAAWFLTLADTTRVGDLCFKGLTASGAVEIGYGLLPEFFGKGYASEAVNAMVEWALAQPGVMQVEAETEPGNAASQRVLAKAGFVPTGTLGEEGPRFVCRERTRVFFVRHARPNYHNHVDALRELSSEGMEDRKRVTEFFQNQKIHAALSSPYKRAVDTIKDYTDCVGLEIETVEGFRERRVDSCWIADFTTFARNQWADFSYKLSDGECLQEVQDRNMAALNAALQKYRGKNILIGSHGTALSTVLHYYRPSFGYGDFERIRPKMPWIAELVYDEKLRLCDVIEHDLEVKA